MSPAEDNPLQAIPQVDELLQRATLQPLWRTLGPRQARIVIRQTLEELRARCTGAPETAPAALAAGLAELEPALAARAQARLRPSLRVVINATGVVLHTNLGRAPLSPAACARLREIGAAYTNLEYELAAGRRGKRDSHVEALACELTGAERTLVVNNNAAALLLLAKALAADGEILISRGELVEIGDGFRVPEILMAAGARLREVGATNRTHLADYRQAAGPATRLILRVHRSNFELSGFTSRPERAELCALGAELGIPVAEDLGSGCLLAPEASGFPQEPTVAACLAAGMSIVTYSGDKLLGGPQAGLLSGRKIWLDRLRAEPLFRALRVDRLTLAALEATLDAYARESAEEVPVWRMLRARDLEARARAFALRLAPAWRAAVEADDSPVGGGALPGTRLRSWVIWLHPESIRCEELARRLRLAEPAVLARIQNDRLGLDLRTVAAEQEDALAGVCARLAAGDASARCPAQVPGVTAKG